MSENFAIRLNGVGKMYKLFPTRLDNMLDALGVARFIPARRHNYREFWALRDIDLELPKGARIGIIGRNGAGKSTLLKLITGNLPPTEGAVEVNGSIQALLTSGAGFNPEFTGYENMRAALTYQGLDSKKIEVATRDIAEFTELGNYLGQPFKNYSSGMQARLTFAVATTLKPDILIVDEVLGAGDAYFAAKSAERMKELVEESGASVLIVSHALSEIMRYCDESIWIERGQIVANDSSIEVVKAYEEFVHNLDDRRLKAKNRKRQMPGYGASQLDGYGDHIQLDFCVQGDGGAYSDIAYIALLNNGQPEAELHVGDVQDTDWSHNSVLAIENYNWSNPKQLKKRSYYRSLIVPPGNRASNGAAVFNTYMFFPNVEYSCRIRYRLSRTARLSLNIFHNGKLLEEGVEFPNDTSAWQEWEYRIGNLGSQETKTSVLNAPSPIDSAEQPVESIEQPAILSPKQTTPTIRRWPSEGSLLIDHIYTLDSNGEEKSMFKAGEKMVIRVTVRAQRDGVFDLITALALHRIDGIYVTIMISPPMFYNLAKGEKKDLYAVLDPLNLGDATYYIAGAIFEKEVDESSRYDLIDRSYEFRVINKEKWVSGWVFSHPAVWQVG